MSLFKETPDIQTADMLKLPVPKANYHNVVLKPSEQQKEMVKSLSERAEKVRNKMVDSSVDNMLLITNDGRKLAIIFFETYAPQNDRLGFLCHSEHKRRISGRPDRFTQGGGLA